MNQDWKIEIDGKVFELDRNSEEHQIAYQFLNAETYEEKLQIWIDNFAILEFGWRIQPQRVHEFRPIEFEWNDEDFGPTNADEVETIYFHIHPANIYESYVLLNALNEYIEIDIKIAFSLLLSSFPRNQEQAFFYNKMFQACVKIAMDKFDKELLDFGYIDSDQIFSSDFMLADIKRRSAIAPVPLQEFFENELSIIGDWVCKVEQGEFEIDLDAPYVMFCEDFYCAPDRFLMNGKKPSAAYPPIFWRKEVFRFQVLLEEELKKIKAGKPFEPDLPINWIGGGIWMHPRKFWIKILAYQYAQIIFYLEQRIKNLLEEETLSGKSEGLKTFRWIKDPEKELPILYEKMRGELISPETTLEQFTAIFTGRPIEEVEPVEWIRSTTLLAYFIDQIKNVYQKIPGYTAHWVLGEKCFFHDSRNITSGNLRSSQRNYTGNQNNKGLPKDHELIDQLF